MSTLEQRRKFYDYAHEMETNMSEEDKAMFGQEGVIYEIAVMCGDNLSRAKDMQKKMSNQNFQKPIYTD